MTRVLLVTGSRSLATIPGAEAWARALIRTALEGVDVLFVGDAPGPDLWAEREAAIADVPVWRFVTRGLWAGHVEMDTPRGVEHSRWSVGSDTHPLNRNAAMVRCLAHARDTGDTVAALALLDGTKRDAPGKRATRGTEHTAGLAERAGITVQREVWR